jgi:hypothetical protein
MWYILSDLEGVHLEWQITEYLLVVRYKTGVEKKE